MGSSFGSVIVTLEHAVYVLPLLFLAAFFSGTESALMSLGLAHREALRHAPASDRASARVLWLLQNPRRLITTIILGNEITNILLSEVMTKVVGNLYQMLPLWRLRTLAPSRETLTAVTATLFTVPLLVTFGELIPKTIGIKLAERWAKAVWRPTVFLTWVLWVPRLLVSAVADAVLFLLVGRGSQKTDSHTALSEKQFRTLVDLGSAEGQIQRTEAQLIHNVLDFGDHTVGELMTKASDVFALPIDMPLGRIVDAVVRRRYSRVPVYRGRRDHVVGVLFTKDIVGYSAGTPHLQGRTLADLLHPPLFVPRRAKCDRVFREFQRRKTHMALVVDEYGRLAGLVTMEDLLHSLFGDIVSVPPESSDLSTMPPVDSAKQALPKPDGDKGEPSA